MNYLSTAKEAWEGMADIRSRRSRLKRFTYGRQWDDLVKNPETGEVMTEKELITREGRAPLTNNLLRQLVKSIIGRYRNISDFDNGDVDKSLSDLYLAHGLTELDSRLLEEYLISGIAVQRMGTDAYSRGKNFPLVENVSPQRVFFKPPADPRCTDMRLIGALHDYTPQEVAMKWGGDRRDDVLCLLKKLQNMSADGYGSGQYASPASFEGTPAGLVRVIEVWSKECCEYYTVHDPENATIYNINVAGDASARLEDENMARAGKKRPKLRSLWHLGEKWTGRWYLADGTLLDKVALPLDAEQPFLLKLYPLIDGEVHSLVEDVIDQQKYVNRLINLLDRMMATTAKGALLFPVDAVPDGFRPEDVARQWSAVDGVVLYRSAPNRPEPRQLHNSVGDIGAKDLLKIQMQLFQDISGVGDALAGRNLPSNVGAQRYSMEVENASVALKDVIDSFSSLITQRNVRLLKYAENMKLKST